MLWTLLKPREWCKCGISLHHLNPMMYKCLKLYSCWSCPSESYGIGRVVKCTDITGWRCIITNLHMGGRSLILTSQSCLHWQGQISVETSVAEQPCSGRAQLTYLLWEGARKSALNIACQLKLVSTCNWRLFAHAATKIREWIAKRMLKCITN